MFSAAPEGSLVQISIPRRAAVERLRHPRTLDALGWGAMAMLLTALASAGLAAYLRRAARGTGTPLLEADALHYASDLWANAGALLALGLEHVLDWGWADPLISLALVAWILRGALRGASRAVS